MVRKETKDEPGKLQRGRSLYSRALCEVVGEERAIRDIKTLKSVKHIGPKISKDIVENLWRQFPSAYDSESVQTEEAGSSSVATNKAESEDEGEKPRRKKKKKPIARREYKPACGTANYAFLVILAQALERGEDSLSKNALMARADKSGLCTSSIYGNDPLLQRKLAQNGSPNVRLFCFSGWTSAKTMINREVPLIEVFGRPMRIKLTKKGHEVAKELYEKALLEGKINEAEVITDPVVKSPQCTEKNPGQCSSLEEQETVGIQGLVPVQLPFQGLHSSFDDEFEIVLVIDQREQFTRVVPGTGILSRTEALSLHLDVLDQAKILVSIRQLDLGDAVWIARRKAFAEDEEVEEYLLDFIVERKSVEDLAVSIIDKRYEQQKYWLRDCGLQNVLYVVEGDPELHDRGNAVKTALVLTEVFDSFRLFKTTNYNDTLKLYVQITQFLRRLYQEASHDIGSGKWALSLSQFRERLAFKKKLKCKDIWGLFLTKIPGIGADSAACIMEQYPTPSSFYAALATSEEEQIKILSDLETEAERKLGKAKAKKIIDCLFPNRTTSSSTTIVI